MAARAWMLCHGPAPCCCEAMAIRRSLGPQEIPKPSVAHRGPSTCPRCVRLTQDAYAHGFALALPAQVSVPLQLGCGRPRKYMSIARPTGVGRAITAYDMPIEGRDEWLAAARRLA